MRGPAVLFAGPGARRVLLSGARGEIVVAGSAGAYAQLGDDHVHICAAGAPLGPLSVAVARSERLDLRPGVGVAALPGKLLIGNASISLERMRVRGRAAAPGARPAVDERIVAAVHAALPALRTSLRSGVRALQDGDIPTAVATLAGRGAGLTPDGDDVLAGYAAWRHATGCPVAMARAAAPLASPIGLSYLRCAERGELPEVAAILLTALRAGDAGAARAALPALLRWGSSSGAALAHGMVAAASERPDRSSRGWPARQPRVA